VIDLAKTSVNPFGDFRTQCSRILSEALKESFPDVAPPSLTLDIPPIPQFGELSSSVCFELAKKLRMSPLEIAKQIEEKAEEKTRLLPLVESVKAERPGYVNFYVNLPELASLTFRSAVTLDSKYGYVKTESPERIIVEHTSANPIHPIHIGHARNSVLGDSLARILEARGHTVFRHYYIDDVGRQSAIIAYGYRLVGKPKPDGKPDHYIGAIYSITSCMLEIHRLKREINEARRYAEKAEDFQRLQRELDDWVAVAAELKEKFPDLFERILDEFSKEKEPELEVSRLLREYESGEGETRDLIRKISQICIEGFKQTFARCGISIDSWDWESTFVWNGEVSRYLEALQRTPFVFREAGVLELDAEAVAETLGLKEEFGVREDQEIPSLTLVRADGTSLYTTRDIAYSIWKFKRADRVINVIGMEQKLSQLQLRLALCALGYVDQARRLIHFAYNLVRLPGRRMSGRRGRYVTFDDLIDEAVGRAYDEVSKRSPSLTEETKRRISEIVGVGAVKYALVETDPLKPVIFTWDKVLNFERNSAPYIQYSHARACSILRRAGETRSGDFRLLKEKIEREILLTVSRFPEIFIEAAESLKPHLIADYTNSLADKFNTFYASLPVMRAEPPELRDARIMLVDAVRITIRNALNLLGIEAPERM
jgi:arginyl-tRNA synthetase